MTAAADEERQLEELRSRLRREYPDVEPDLVDAAIDQSVDELRGARIRNFVVVLVERSARRRIEAR